MATDSQAQSNQDAPAGPRQPAGRRTDHPAVYWVVLTTAVTGGLMTASPGLTAAAIAWNVEKEHAALIFI